MHPLDVAILVAYFVGIVAAGMVVSRRAGQGVDSYFLGGRSIPWYLLGISNASGQFDITGTMWMVMLMFVYGLKSLWIPWLWPTFNQVFLMVFLAAWLRRSNVLTGAEWLRTRFGSGRGLELAHASVVVFALVTVISFLAYAFVGIGKFAEAFLPWDLSPNAYALAIMAGTALYVIAGGMYSVVLTDLAQFVLLSCASVAVAVIAMAKTTRDQIIAAVPGGWDDISFSWRLDLDWSSRLEFARQQIAGSDYEYFTVFLMMALLKGVLASLAGPTPNYDMQRVLATRSPRESCLMSGLVSPVLYLPRYFLIAGITVLGLVYFSETLATMGDDADIEQVLPYVMQDFLPPGLKGILLAGLFAAFMSTFDSTINAGAAYLVNDIYRRYFRPSESASHYMRASYAGSLGVVLVGGAAGVMIAGPAGWVAASTAAEVDVIDQGVAAVESEPSVSIDDILQWITAGLYGGYVAPNVLKWIWWRLNGAGYFAGMIAGVALALLNAMANWASPLYLFPAVLLASGAASVAVSLMTKPDDRDVLREFCRTVRPWGFWKPIEAELQAANADYQPNGDFGRDMLNCTVGIFWQVALCALPVYIILRDIPAAAGAGVVILAATYFLKRNWYDGLGERGEGRVEGRGSRAEG